MPVRSKITALTMNLTIAHVIAILFVALIVLISLLLGKCTGWSATESVLIKIVYLPP